MINFLVKGAGSIGYPGVIHGMFPQGGADLVSYFYASCNQKLAEQLKEATKTPATIQIRLVDCILLIRVSYYNL